MAKWQWRLAIGSTLILAVVQVAEDQFDFASPVSEMMWEQNEWLSVPELPVASSDFIPVTADIKEDQEFIYSSYQPFEKGLLLRVESPQPVLAKGSGMVLFTGEKRKTGKTMTVAYDSGDTVTYGFLDQFNFLPYTRFSSGDALGSSSTDLFYIQHDNDSRLLDPESLLMWLLM